MLERLPRGWRNTSLVVLGLLILGFAWSIRSVVNPLLLGYLGAYILHPAVERLERRGFSRRSSVLMIFLSAFAVSAAIALAIGLQLRNLVRDVVQNEEMRTKFGAKFEELRNWLKEYLPEGYEVPDPAEMWAQVQAFLSEHTSAVGKAGAATVEAAGGLFDIVGNVIGGIVALGGLFVLVPLYTYYMLFEISRVNAWFRGYIPKGEQERFTRVAGQIGSVLANFFRGRLLVCLLKGVLITLGLLIVQVPYPILFGMLGGFLSVIPFVGPTAAFLGAFVVAITQGDMGLWGAVIRTGLVFGVAEVLEGYVLIPKIMGDSLGLHDVVVLFALLAGGAALGMFGVLIALPLTATIVILFREFVVPALKDWIDEDDPESKPRPPESAG